MSLQQQQLRLEDAILIRNIYNVKLANQMLMLRRKKYNEEQQQQAQANAQANAQQQQMSIQGKAEVDAQLKQMEIQADLQKLQAEYEMKEVFATAEHQRNLEILASGGEIKSEHIKLAQDDSDLVRTRVK